MPQVTVEINRRKYNINCEDGEEEHLKQLSQFVDGRVSELVASLGQVGDTRLLVMASLLVADELSEVYTELNKLRGAETPSFNASLTAEHLESMAQRIESIADKLEAS